MFGQDVTVAVQDPSYPVYVDSSVIMGMTGNYNHDKQAFNSIEYMPCRPETGFFPDLSKVRNQKEHSRTPASDVAIAHVAKHILLLPGQGNGSHILLLA